MPTYEFRCPDGTIVEKMFKMSEVPDSIPNPNGEGEAVRIISGGAGLLFKGTGFYITDYGKDGKKDQRDNAAAQATASAKSAAAKTEGSSPAATGSAAETSTKSESAAKPAAPAAAAPSSPPKSSGSKE